MSQRSPFSHLFQLFGNEPKQHVESINRDALEKMMHLLQLPVNADGRCILLRAPRAGYGKSHLLSRVQSLLGSSHEFILLQPTDGYRMDANAALNDVISKLTHTLPGGAGLSEFDLLARKIFALGLGSLVRSGEVPCQDRETTLAALQNRPVETFDFHHHTAVTAHWARNHFAILRPLLIVEIAKIIAAPLREVSFWVDALFRYAVTPLDQPSRSGMLMEAVVDASATAPMNERLATLLKMLTQWQRVILVADELEGMSVNAEAALRFAAFLTKLRLGAERVDMIISVNDDIWESAFVPRLSGGLQDRLSEAVVRLAPLRPEQAWELLLSRDPHAKREQSPDFTSQGPLYSRLVLSTAAQSWQPSEEDIAATKTPESLSGTSEENITPPAIVRIINEEDLPQVTESDHGVPIFSADKSFSEPDFPFVDDNIAAYFEVATKSIEEPIFAFAPAETDEVKGFDPSPYAYADETLATSFMPSLAAADTAPEPEIITAAPACQQQPQMITAQVISAPPNSPKNTVIYDAPVLKPTPINSVKPSPLPYGEVDDPSHAATSSAQTRSSEINRVDELLRQFRERYGRSDS